MLLRDFNYIKIEIMGFKAEVMAEMTKEKVGKFVELANKDFPSLAKKYGLTCKNLIKAQYSREFGRFECHTNVI